MILTDFVLGSVALGALLWPGWLAARAARVAQPLVAGFIASAVALLSLVLVLSAVGARLTFTHLALPWLVLTLGLAGLRWKFFSAPPAAGVPRRQAWRDHWPLFLALGPALAVVGYRAVAQPLFGYDTMFRWDYLARQMLARGDLGFYPPVSGADYAVYAWPDGIAPAVSSLYLWIYALAGATRPELTAPVVIGQYGLLLAAVFALARRLFSDRAAAFACAIAACCPIIGWATAMGQETGLTALAVTALLLYLPRDRGEETAGAVVFAGLAAGLGGLAREYGLALIVLGFGLAVGRRLSRRSLLLFASAAALAVLPWYGRNWLRTGNPLFNLDVGGWFPVNPVHAWMNQSYHTEFGWSRQSLAALRFVLVNGGVALLGWLAGAWFYFRPARAVFAAIGLVILLWAVSLGYTAAGFTTAVRVLSPALALGAVLAGAVAARWVPAQRNLAGASLALGFIAIDAALRALTLPGTVYKIPPADWLTAGRAMTDYNQDPLFRQLAQAAGTERILVLGPNALLTQQGAQTLPFWSPEVAFLFDDRLAPVETARRLRAAGIGFVLLTRGKPNELFLAHSAYIRDPGNTLRAIWGDDYLILLRVVGPDSAPR